MKHVVTLALFAFTWSAIAQTEHCNFSNQRFESPADNYAAVSDYSDAVDACEFSVDANIPADYSHEDKRAIPFNVKDLDGNYYNLEDLIGKVIVVNFWFIDCKPCTMEIPDLNNMVAGFEGQDIVFLGMALDSEESLRKFLKDNPFSYKVIPNCKDIVTAYGIKISPGHVVIGKDGQVSYTSEGLTTDTVSNLQKAIEAQL